MSDMSDELKLQNGAEVGMGYTWWRRGKGLIGHMSQKGHQMIQMGMKRADINYVFKGATCICSDCEF